MRPLPQTVEALLAVELDISSSDSTEEDALKEGAIFMQRHALLQTASGGQTTPISHSSPCSKILFPQTERGREEDEYAKETTDELLMLAEESDDPGRARHWQLVEQ